MRTFRVIDCKADTEEEGKIVKAGNPEAAAREVLGLDLVRGGHQRDLRARVYSQQAGQPLTLVRLYARRMPS